MAAAQPSAGSLSPGKRRRSGSGTASGSPPPTSANKVASCLCLRAILAVIFPTVRCFWCFSHARGAHRLDVSMVGMSIVAGLMR